MLSLSFFQHLLKHHESLRLGKRPALPYPHHVAGLGIYALRVMGLYLRLSPLVPFVFRYVLVIVPRDYGRVGRLARDYFSLENPAAYLQPSVPWTLLAVADAGRSLGFEPDIIDFFLFHF